MKAKDKIRITDPKIKFTRRKIKYNWMVNKTKEITFNGLQEDSYWKIF